MSNMNLPVLPDGYEYVQELGRGAQGCVWLIRNNNTGGRHEACKVVTSISPKELSRFKREIQLLATLNHPNIITIFYANQKEKFFIMEYVSGGNLYNYCRQKVLNLKQRIQLFSSITEGLSFAHNKGLIHRDLKPENIVMSDDGIAKITDFGIARLSDSSSQTMNITSGTPSYMAPELWSQSPPDQRSDIWSLGIILYEMLTGKCPFKGTVQEICYMVTQGNLKAPHVVSSLPPLGQKMSVICMKALKQDPIKRYQNCEELLADIKNATEKGEDELQTSIGLSTDLAFKDDDDDDDAMLEDPDFSSLTDDIEEDIPVLSEPLKKDVSVTKSALVPKVKPMSIAPVKNTGSLDFEDDEDELLDENSNSPQDSPENKPISKPSIFDQYKYPIVGAAVFFVMVLALFLIMPASLSTLQEQLLSNDIEEQKVAFVELKTRGEEAVESLVYGLNSSQVKMRKDIIEHISQYPESASYYLSEVIEDFSKIFNHQAKIYAVRALGNLKVDSEISLQNLVISASTPEDLRQEAIKSLVKLKPNIYKRKYHFMGGLWLSTRDLRKQGYIRTEQGWVLVSKMFGDLQSNISKASLKYKGLMQTEQKVFDDLAKGKHLYLEDFISEWDKLFSDYKNIVIEFDVLTESVEDSLDIEKEYGKIIKDALMTLHLGMVECADNFISVNATGLAIKILKKELENISLVMSWKRISFPIEKARALKTKHGDLVKENTLFVYTKFNFFGDYDTSSFQDRIIEIMDRAILKEDLYPRFSSKSPKIDKPKHWIICEYRETNIGSYHGNRDKKRKDIRRLRASCNFSYWVDSNKVKNWQQVISSNIYLELANKVDDEQKEICNMVRNDFKEKLTSWKPKEFNQQVIKSDSNTVEKVKGSTIYSQTALDIIYTKDKRKIKGLIKKENSKEILFTVVKISKGSTSFVEVKIRKSKIAKIKRIPDEVRETRLQDIKNLSQQKLIDRKKIDLVPLEKVPWEFGKGTGLVYTGKFFTLYCNTPENFTREIAFRTESIFEAYQRFFPVTRNSDKKIKIYIFNSTAEYQKAIGRAFANPAFYSPTKNHIMASCDLAAYESSLAKTKKHNDKIFALLAKNERIIAKHRNRITRQKRTLHNQLDKKLARGQIKQRDYDVAYRNIGNQIDKINRQINALLKEQRKHRAEGRYIASKNRKLIPKYIDQMIEMMYHEAFHAFMKNFLFTEEQTMYVPRWLNEGLAQYFESSFFSGNRLIIGEMDKGRLSFLKKFTKRKNAVPVKDLLVAGYKDFIVTSSDNLENSNLHYIQSWATVHFVTTLFDLRKGDVFGSYIRNIWSGKDQIEAFEELVGMPVDEFEKKWLAFFQE
ncbi:protein kinase [Candidatus Uabimicrobium sp. HlEnr_7]|uniref:serine/threonine-protein kinase n=1 Tax=Candidatus Uabimicrobium helgolandensis TaxID=3095367 RepID=UPI0035590149